MSEQEIEEFKNKLKLLVILQKGDIKSFVQRIAPFNNPYCLYCEHSRNGLNFCDLDDDVPTMWMDDSGEIIMTSRNKVLTHPDFRGIRQRCVEWVKYV